MGYFPFFIEFADKKGLVVGGGTVALRKVVKLLPFAPSLTVAAQTVLPEIEDRPEITVLHEPFSPEMLEGMYFVIAATDDAAVNQEIGRLCREQGILVNVVDAPDDCTFLFPALVKEGNLSVGISTGGASPSASVWLKETIREQLPENMEEILDFLASVRIRLKGTIPENQRSKLYADLFDACMNQGRGLTENELAKMLEEIP